MLVVLCLVAVLAILGPPGASTTRDPATPVITASVSVAPSPSPGRVRPATRPAATICSRHHQVLRVLQFNIHFGVSREGLLDLGQLATEIRAARPDVVSLNEVDSRTRRSRGIDEAGFLADATDLHAVYGPNLPWQGGLFGNAILTRYPVLSSHNLRLPVRDGLEPRGLLTVTLRVGGHDVSFSSVHLTDGPGGRASRVLQAEAVAAVLRHSSDPTIVSGDLNAQPHDRPVRILRQYLLDAQEYGGTGSGDTIPETAPASRFDYVLYDDALAVVPGSTRVLPSDSSDHRSVSTELALVPSPCVH